MPRRRREIRAVEPLKMKDLRGDVLERGVSHSYWQTMNDLGSSPMPGSYTCRVVWLVRHDMSSVFLGEALASCSNFVCLVPAWPGMELRRM
jgi:hypothetical protein